MSTPAPQVPPRGASGGGQDQQRRPRVPAGWPLGQVFGIPLLVSPSWVIVAAFITISFGPVMQERVPSLGNAAYLFAFIFAVLLWLSVLVHELAHSLTARAFGLPVHRIMLNLFGGYSEIDREPTKPGRELVVALMGPLSSLVLGGVCLLAGTAINTDSLIGVLVLQLTWANLFVGFFNLLPGLPLDGGRVVASAVWWVTKNRERGTIFAAHAGTAVAVVVAVAPVLLRQSLGLSNTSVVWGVLIAISLFSGSQQALRQAKVEGMLSRVTAGMFARPFVTVPGDSPLSLALVQLADQQAGAIVISDSYGELTGIVDEAAVSAVPMDRRPWVSVSSLSRGLDRTMHVASSLSGEDLLEALRNAAGRELLIDDASGTPVGVLSIRDVERRLAAGM